jgi:predicted O-methyltransferase YrrM
VKFEEVEKAVAGIPHMSPAQGRVMYDHILEAKPTDILELGTARGVSAAYMAAALDELGRGRIVTYDRASNYAANPPGPEGQAFAKLAPLLEYVEFVRPDHSSYDWWLAREIEKHSDEHGNCEPQYDFCYLDGAHEFTIDGLAIFLCEKLLRPGAWLVLDDLNWSFAIGGVRSNRQGMSDDEFGTAHMRLAFDVIVRQHPSFTEFRDQDGAWGWAKKAPGEPRRYSLETSQSMSALFIDRARRASLAVRSRMKR